MFKRTALFAIIALTALFCAQADAVDLSRKLGLGATYAPLQTNLFADDALFSAPPANISLKFGFLRILAVELNAGFWFGEDEKQGFFINPRFDAAAVSSDDLNLYLALGAALGFVNSISNNSKDGKAGSYSDELDLASLEFGMGVEYFVGASKSFGLFAEYMPSFQIEPRLLFSAVNGLKLGFRYYFNL
jgi:hypothetical protein